MGVLVLRADQSAGLDSSEDEQSCYKYQWLKDFARARGVSLNKLVEEWVTVALAQLDGESTIGCAPYTVDQRWAWRWSIHSTAYSDAGGRERRSRASTERNAGKLRRSSVWKFVRKESLPNCRCH
jgi:hypothetical protein